MMSATAFAAANASPPPATAPQRSTPSAAAVSDRRADVDAKQRQVASLLAELDCEGLLVLDQANLAWLTAGASARSILDPEDLPALYYTPAQRWLLCSNVESQRMFDEELDELGYLLKEWPWHWRRQQLLVDLCHERTVACDLPFPGTRPVADRLQGLRRIMTSYEQACLLQLGQILAHALEAACRTVAPGETERELAGQLSHRLLHRGASVASIAVAADGNSRRYRQHGFTSTPIQRYAVVSATARKFGLYLSASRSFSFGSADDTFKQEHFAACKAAAAYIACTWPDAVVGEVLSMGMRTFELAGHEHEWRLSPQGWLTGRTPVEYMLLPESEELLPAKAAVVWGPTVGAAACIDSFLVDENGPQRLTPPTEWPLVSVKVSGAEIICPSILERG